MMMSVSVRNDLNGGECFFFFFFLLENKKALMGHSHSQPKGQIGTTSSF